MHRPVKSRKHEDCLKASSKYENLCPRPIAILKMAVRIANNMISDEWGVVTGVVCCVTSLPRSQGLFPSYRKGPGNEVDELLKDCHATASQKRRKGYENG